MSLPPALQSGIRQSHMNLAHRCMRQLWFYLYKGPARPALKPIAGSAGHRALEHNFSHKLKTGEEAPLPEVLDCFTTVFDEKVKEADLDGEDPKPIREAIVGSSKRIGTLPYFHQQRAPLMQPKLIEEPFSIGLHDVSVPLVGTIDFFSQDGMVSDFKFRFSRMPGKDAAEKSFQLTTYSLALEARGEKVKQLEEVELIAKPGARADVKLIQSKPRSGQQYESALDEYASIVRLVEKAEGDPWAYPMTDPANWWCSKIYCGWANQCSRFGGKH